MLLRVVLVLNILFLSFPLFRFLCLAQMYRCGFASFSIFDFLDYLLDELIDCVSNRCCCCCSNKNFKDSKNSKDSKDSINNTLPRVASTVSVLSPSPNNACYTFAKVIQRDALYKELPVAKMYRLHLNDFLTEICGIPNSTVALIKHAGVGSIAEIAFLVPEKDLLKYTKLGVKKIRVMIRRARRIVGYVNGVNIAKADNERTKALVRQQSFNSNALVRQQGFSFMEDTKQFLDARELNEVADGPVRWQRSPAKAKPNHQKERMDKRESPVSSEMKRVTDETKKTKESKNYDGENKKENNASRPSGTKDIQTHSSLSETVATRKEEQRDTRNNSTITTMTEPEDEQRTTTNNSANESTTIKKDIVLPLCSMKICYAMDHDLTSEGYERLDKNILKGTNNEDEAFIWYRRREPSDRLKWSAKRLEIGDLLDAKDTVNKWCFACVIEKDPYHHPGEIKVHFTKVLSFRPYPNMIVNVIFNSVSVSLYDVLGVRRYSFGLDIYFSVSSHQVRRAIH